MSIQLLLLAGLMLGCGLIAHVVWWRSHHPADDAAALLVLTGILPFLGSLVCWLSDLHQIRGINPASSIMVWLNIIVPLLFLHLLMALVYMSCYTAAQAASPTVLIILACVRRNGLATREQIAADLDDDLVCGNLIEAALNEKFIFEKDGRLGVASRGRILLKMGRGLRAFLGLADPIG